jgi:hypothetical protein
MKLKDISAQLKLKPSFQFVKCYSDSEIPAFFKILFILRNIALYFDCIQDGFLFDI